MLTVKKKLEVKHLDVETTFLNDANLMRKSTSVNQKAINPKNEKVCKLLKALYKLKQGSRF